MKKNALETYIKCLKTYNETTNIYSKAAYDKLPFHIEDSVTLSELILNKKQVVFDFGSGSGLPAIPIAIINPLNKVYAIESKSRKTKFLNQVKEILSLNNLEIVTQNLFEWDPPEQATIITAKAFAALDKVQRIAVHLKQQAATIYMPISQNQAQYMSQQENVSIIEKNTFLYAQKRIRM